MQKAIFKRNNHVLFLLLAGALCLLPVVMVRGQVVAWGQDNDGQTNVPATVTNVLTISAGDYYVLALQPGGMVVGWGYDADGETNPPAVLTNVVAVAGGGGCLALQSNGTVVAWGWDGYGQTDVPAGLSNVVAIASGWQNSLALTANGTVVAWGNSSGGGPGNVVPTNAFNIVGIAQGYHQNLAVRGDGTVVAWGSDPTLGSVPTGISNVVAVAATYDADIVLMSNGTVAAWGNGSLLNGYTDYSGTHPGFNNASVPPGLTNVVAIAGGYFNTMALEANGSIVVWGDDAYGQLNIPAGLTNVNVITTGYGSCVALTGTNAPQIIESPLSTSALAGAPALFVGNASGLAPLSYQWQFNGTNIPGATLSELLLTNLEPQQAGPYTFTVSNSLGWAQSTAGTLTVIPLIVTTGPTNQTLYSGDTLTASVQGTGPFTYQWQFDGVDLPGATNAILSLSDLVTNQPGAYSVIVSNGYGTVTNFPMVTSVFNSAAFIVNQPTNVAVVAGGGAAFQVSANGSQPIGYQWQFNGTNLPGATHSTLLLTNLGYANNGNYSVLVSNIFGGVSSSNATLSVVIVATWGMTGFYGLGNVPGDATNVVAVASGNFHSVILKSNGRVEVWGDDSYGQTNIPLSVTNVMAIAASWDHTLALKTNGTVISWGDMATVPANVSNVVAVAAGHAHSMALQSNGTVLAWGAGTATNVPGGLTNVVAIAAGNNISAALTANKTLVTWGSSVLTNGMTNVVAICANESVLMALRADRTLAVSGAAIESTGNSNVVAIAAGGNYALALLSNGTITNLTYALGYGPATPQGLPPALAIAAGDNAALGIFADGQPLPQAMMTNASRGSNSFSFSTPTQLGHVYAPEYKTSLSATNWLPLPLVTGSGGTMTITDTTGTNAQRLYRLERW